MSGRGLTTAQQNAAAAAHSTAAVLIDVLFASGTLRCTTAGVDLTIGGNTYFAVNKLRTVEALDESQDSTEGLRFTLDALDPAIITLLAGEPYRGRPINVYEVWYDANYQPIGSPALVWPGLMTAMTSSEQDGQVAVVVEAEHFEKELRRPRETRFNDADQRALYPDDKGFEHVEQMTELQLVWPAKEAFKR